MMVKNAAHKWVVFDWWENIEDSMKDMLIITATTTGIFVCTYDSKDSVTENISRCQKRHETCWWNMWRSISQEKMGQKMNQRVNDCLSAWHGQQYKAFITC